MRPNRGTGTIDQLPDTLHVDRQAISKLMPNAFIIRLACIHFKNKTHSI